MKLDTFAPSFLTQAGLEHHVANLASDKSREFGGNTCRPLLQWWSGKTIAEVNGINCRAYVKWRTAQTYRGRKISDQTARHDLKSLRAAIRWYKREVDTSIVVPTVTMPSKAPARMDYFLTRDEVAVRIRAARSSKRTHHVARMLLIGWYTGTRPGATLALRWVPSPTAGWFDLDSGVLHRRGAKTRISNKRQPPARIHARLLPHLRRWHRADTAYGFTHVIRYQGESVKKLRRSWGSVAREAAKLTAKRQSKRTPTSSRRPPRRRASDRRIASPPSRRLRTAKRLRNDCREHAQNEAGSEPTGLHRKSMGRMAVP